MGADPAKTGGGAPPILVLMQCTNLGGMEQVTFRLMEHLAMHHDIRFRILTPRPFGPGEERIRAIDPEAEDSPYRGRFGWRSLRSFRAQVRRAAAGCAWIWVVGTSAAALLAIRGMPQRKLLSHHYHHFEGRGSAVKWRGFYTLLCRQLDGITYPTAFTRDEALQLCPWLKSRAVVVRNGYTCAYEGPEAKRSEARAARERTKLPVDAFIVGNAGWLIRRKRFDVFLKVAARVRERVPTAHFVVAGGGEEEPQLRAQAEELGIADDVTFTGWIKDLRDHYRAWDVNLFHSDFDAIGSTPLEAACEGCALVASVRYGGLPEFIAHEVNGFLITTHDTEALAQAVIRLYAEPQRANRWRAEAARRLHGEFSQETVARFYADLFAGRVKTPRETLAETHPLS